MQNWILAALVAATVATTVYSAQPEKEPKEEKEPKVHHEVEKEAREKGMVKVIIQLNEESGIPYQQQQAAVLAELKGYKHRVVTPMEFFAMALEVEAYALPVLERSEHVLHVSPSGTMTIMLNQSVPQALGTGLTYGTSTKTVAVIDTGTDKAHPFLLNTVIAEACFSSGSDCPNGTIQQTGAGAGVPCAFPVPSTDCRHGTEVAGVISGKSTKSTDPVKMGVAPDSKIVSINVASWNGLQTGSGAGIDEPDIVKALNHVLTLSAVMPDIVAVNMSLGNRLVRYDDQIACDKRNPAMKTAIDKLRDKKIAVIIASGNESDGAKIAFPGCISSAVSVGASTDSNTIASFSNSAPFLSLLAPGAAIITSIPGGGFTPTGINGTSFAAPHVTGAWAVVKQQHPTATVAQVLNALQTNGFRITDTRSSRKNCRIQIGGARTNLKPTVYRFPITEGAAYDLNNCGQVVGVEYVNWTGFRTSTNGSKTALLFPGADFTEPWGINNKDEISGFMADPVTWYDTGFVWANGAFRKDKPSGTTSNDTFKNNDTLTTGYGYFDAVKTYLGYTLKGGSTLVKLAANVFPEDIDNRGRFAGWKGLYTDHAGVIRRYNYPNADGGTYIHGRNESGKLVGEAWIGSVVQGFLWDSVTGKLTNFAPGREPFGVNDSRQIVGYDNNVNQPYIDLSW
jgi:subtilisin